MYGQTYAMPKTNLNEFCIKIQFIKNFNNIDEFNLNYLKLYEESTSKIKITQ